MSGGRAELGLGTGWFDAEHTAYGTVPAAGRAVRPPRRTTEDRHRAVGNRRGRGFSFSGTPLSLSGSPALPKPAQRPRPPVLIGGAGQRRTPRLAASFADEYNIPFASVADSTAAFDRVRQACQEGP